MNCEEARSLFVDYWSDALTGGASEEFSLHLEACQQCRSEAESLKGLWTSLSAIPEEDPGPRTRTRFHDLLRSWRQAESVRRGWFPLAAHPAFQAVAAALILTLGIGAGYLLRSQEGARGASSGQSEIAQLRAEVSNMRQLVALSLLQQQNASDRLRGVSYAYRVEHDDPQVVDALLTTVSLDSNVNVRLAAVDALSNVSSPAARLGLEQTLDRQTSPLVQIAILDQLVQWRDRAARAVVESLVSDRDADPEVRQHAQWALREIQ